jgi:hypothetical protein
LTEKAEDLAPADIQVDAGHSQAGAETLGDAPKRKTV